jgi:hypothetical protein
MEAVFSFSNLKMLHAMVTADPLNMVLTVTRNLNLHAVGMEYALSFLQDAFPGGFPGIKIIPTTGTEIMMK